MEIISYKSITKRLLLAQFFRFGIIECQSYIWAGIFDLGWPRLFLSRMS
jgi:hypothetical protein